MIFLQILRLFGGHGSGLRSRQAGFKAENARHSGWLIAGMVLGPMR